MNLISFLIAVSYVNIIYICIMFIRALVISERKAKKTCYCEKFRRRHFVVGIGFMVTYTIGVIALVIEPIDSDVWLVMAMMNAFAQTI